MTPKAGYPTPLLHVSDVERSVRFYRLLGFEVVDVERSERGLEWARVHAEGGALMFLRSEEVSGSPGRGFLLYLYTPDLPGLRARLEAEGVEVGPIRRPPYMPSGEVRLEDPDGTVILVGHWGEAEHAAWEQARERKRAEGLFP